MKKTFFKIPKIKRDKIIKSALIEFGKNGYEKCSLDLIIKRANISKGGLYEYINSKEDLYIYLVSYSYDDLYEYIKNHIKENNLELPGDILDRFYLVSKIAIDYYIEKYYIIEFIVKSNYILNTKMKEKINEIFTNHFLEIFSDFDDKNLKYEKNQILDLIKLILYKTRQDFLSELHKNKKDVEKIKNKYLNNWQFYISVLRDGIYKK